MKRQKKLIKKVFENKANKQKLVTIPKESDIRVGDLVEISKVGHVSIKMDKGVAGLDDFERLVKEVEELKRLFKKS